MQDAMMQKHNNIVFHKLLKRSDFNKQLSPGNQKFLALPKCIEWQFKAAFNKDDKISRII